MERFDHLNEGVKEQEIMEMSAEDLESASLEPELTEVPEIGTDVLVGGDPYGVKDQLDDNQGDNIFNFQGDCGLVSVSNILTMAGIDSSEDSVVALAIATGLCSHSELNEPAHNGGTNVYQRQQLLEIYGVHSEIYDDKNGAASLDSIARYVDAGYGVNMSVNAGYAWDEPFAIGDGGSNHSIVVTGTAYDPDTGELIGLMVCDSGLTDRDSGARFLSVDVLKDAYVDAPRTTVLVTTEPIRE